MTDPEMATIHRLQALRQVGDDRTLTLDAQAQALFARHHPAVVGYCRSLVRRADVADELASEVMLIAWSRLDTFEGRGSFRSWLLGIAWHVCMQSIKKRTEVLVEDGVFEDLSVESAVWRTLDRERRREVLLAAIDGLSHLDQEVAYLRYFEHAGLSDIEREVDLGDLKSGARGALQRMRRHLKKALRGVMEEKGLKTSFFLSGG